ncbi:plasmid stabilization protein [Craurococcus roseus]|uniref:Plasmid stabilization protein n=1 Tax=Craurococcus roseus TaxID=77585 RepID=A0ABP3RF19_9PROT
MSAADAHDRQTSLLIRNLDVGVKRALGRRAATSGVSMEVEVRRILAGAVAEFVEEQAVLPVSLGAAMTTLFGKDAGVELDLPPREAGRAPPDCGGAGAA